MSLPDELLQNPDVARALCIAVAMTAQSSDLKVNARELGSAFNRLVRSLDRTAFVDECRQLERMGPQRYLDTVVARLRKKP